MEAVRGGRRVEEVGGRGTEQDIVEKGARKEWV
jgi:hypothetical protein